jgi:uncharacterized protein YraI
MQRHKKGVEEMRKFKISMLLCISVLMICLFAFSSFAMPGDVNQTNSTANMRSGPGRKYQKTGYVPAGATVGIRETQNDWSYVDYNGQLGWVYSPLIGAEQPSENTSSSDLVEHTVSRKVNLREKADITSHVFVVLNPGMKVDVESVSGSWAHCYYENYEGYCYAAYIEGLVAAPASLEIGETNGPGNSSGSSQYVTPAPPDNETDSVYNGFDYSNVYDYSYYRSHNSDLVSALGNDSRNYIRHFVEYGMDEGRQANARFNVYSYRNSHTSLKNKFGNSLKRYYLYACGYYD